MRTEGRDQQEREVSAVRCSRVTGWDGDTSCHAQVLLPTINVHCLQQEFVPAADGAGGDDDDDDDEVANKSRSGVKTCTIPSEYRIVWGDWWSTVWFDGSGEGVYINTSHPPNDV